MGNQKQRLPTVASLDSDKLKVIEIYDAFQGEGIRAGEACVFLRLAGCTVGCTWCDTKFSWKAAQGTEYSPEELSSALLLHPFSSRVIITGGEPFEHPTSLLGDLLLTMKSTTRVTFETSGTGHENFSPEDLIEHLGPTGQEILFSISPKLPGSHSKKPFPNLSVWQNIAAIIGAEIQIKPVIADQDDLDFFVEYMSMHPNLWGEEIIFQPATDQTLTSIDDIRRQIATDCTWLMSQVQDLVTRQKIFYRNIRVLPQVHAMIFGHKRGV